MAFPCGTFNTRYEQDIAIIRTRTQWLLTFLAIAFFITLALWLPADWLVWLLISGTSVIAVLGMHITTGLCGQFTIGQGAFVAVGAYTAGILGSRYGMSPWATLPLAAIAAGVAGAVFAFPAARIKGFYLVLSTMAAQFIITWALLTPAKDWTGGVNGISVPYIVIGGARLGGVGYWWLTFGLVLMAILAAKNIQRANIGRRFIAIRDSELAAEVMGIAIFPTKVLSFMIGSLFAGVAGWLLAHYYIRIIPEQFSFELSMVYLGMLIVGGMGSTTGAVLGTMLLRLADKVGSSVGQVLLTSYPTVGVRVFPIASSILVALIVICFILLAPKGLYHLVQQIKTRIRSYPFY
jgi:branched-chain amino acid transport system permease protein